MQNDGNMNIVALTADKTKSSLKQKHRMMVTRTADKTKSSLKENAEWW